MPPRSKVTGPNDMLMHTLPLIGSPRTKTGQSSINTLAIAGQHHKIFKLYQIQGHDLKVAFTTLTEQVAQKLFTDGWTDGWTDGHRRQHVVKT